MEIKDNTLINKTIYKLANDAFYPSYMGVIYGDLYENYNLFSFYKKGEPIPKEIRRISDIFNNKCNEYYEIIDFSTDESGSGIRFKKLNNGDNIVIYLFFAIECDENQKAVLLPYIENSERIWLNEEVVTIYRYLDKKVITVDLKKGINYFCFEQPSPNEDLNLSLRIRSLKSEFEDNCSIINDNLYYRKGEFSSYFYTNVFPEGEGIFKFTLLPYDTISLEKANIEVYNTDFYNTKRIKLFEGCVGKEYSIFVDKLYYDNSLPFNSPVIEYRAICNNSLLYSCYTEIRLNPLFNAAQDIVSKAKKHINDGSFNKQAIGIIEYFISNIETLGFNSFSSYYWCRMLEYAINNKENFDGYVKIKGVEKVYYISDLDKKVVFYNIHLPEEYNKKSKYPLIIVVPTYDVTDISSKLNYSLLNESVICAEIDCRGITFGSYIGEASFIEARKDIIERFHINEKRIYMIGHCAGANAALMQIALFPHIYAGAIICGGSLRKDYVNNLLPSSIINISSNEGEDVFAKMISTNNPSSLICTYMSDKITHPFQMNVLFQRKAISKLLKHSIDEQPVTFKYYSENNRHLKAHWIRIHSLNKFDKALFLDVMIKDDILRIEADNVTGLFLELPDNIQKTINQICINNKYVISLVNKTKTHNIIFKNNRIMSANPFIIESKAIFWGAGIIDVYLDSLCIINCDPKSDHVSYAIKNLKCPMMNTTVPRIRIEYPEYYFNDNFCKSNNLIIVDNNSNINQINKKVRDACIIKTNGSFFELNGRKYYGNYCVMQIITNPWCMAYSLLYVNTNNEELYNKFLFTRRMILPTYLFGKSPLLNTIALVYYKNNYWVVSTNDPQYQLCKVSTIREQ